MNSGRPVWLDDAARNTDILESRAGARGVVWKGGKDALSSSVARRVILLKVAKGLFQHLVCS